MHFNPRTREGCDADLLGAPYRTVQISIHAPVKGATVFLPFHRSGLPYFNPRTREGCDKGIRGIRSQFIIYFNPRTREGCDEL